jgi:hypothetical protein
MEEIASRDLGWHASAMAFAPKRCPNQSVLRQHPLSSGDMQVSAASAIANPADHRYQR